MQKEGEKVQKMFEDLKRLIEHGAWPEARELADRLYQDGESSDSFWILNGTVYEAEGKDELVYACIMHGLRQNPKNYELYFMLGNYYSVRNVNQAWLCYERALSCCDNDDDRDVISQSMKQMAERPEWCVNPVSVVMTAIEDIAVFEQCIESFRMANAEEEYELIVVDSGAGEDMLSRLKEKDGIQLVRGRRERGLAAARNRGIKAAAPENDIFLVNGDTIFPYGALFWIRMGLYERDTVGAAGPLTNLCINDQGVGRDFECSEQYMQLAEQLLVSEENAYENKIWLSDFAMLIKRRALDDAGLFDARYNSGMYADTDYGMKLIQQGYELLLCHNSLVYSYHIQDLSVCRHQCLEKERLYEKWGFQVFYYSNIRDELIDLFSERWEPPFRVLEIGCGMGANLAHIRYRFPGTEVYGIELMQQVARFGTDMADIIVGDIETMRIPYEHHYFDAVIMGDVLEHLRNPGEVLVEMKKYLKPGGRLVAGIPNFMNISVVVPLLRGRFMYQEQGLLDRTHIHFFTKQEIFDMFSSCGYKIIRMLKMSNREEIVPEAEKMIDAIYQLPGIADQEQFEVYQYAVTAIVNE